MQNVSNTLHSREEKALYDKRQNVSNLRKDVVSNTEKVRSLISEVVQLQKDILLQQEQQEMFINDLETQLTLKSLALGTYVFNV